MMWWRRLLCAPRLGQMACVLVLLSISGAVAIPRTVPEAAPGQDTVTREIVARVDTAPVRDGGQPSAVTPSKPDPSDAAPASDAGNAPADGRNHEAAAGPQPEDSGPAAPAPTVAPVQPPATAGLRVGIQAGHWKEAQLPNELASLRTATGTSGGGVSEPQLTLDIAGRVAALLEPHGIHVDVLPATVPPQYQADAFVALHADGDTSGKMSGYKLARARWSAIPQSDDALLASIADAYGRATTLPVDKNVTPNMTAYYAFNYRLLTHAIAPSTPAVILEMGFMTNPSDLRTLLGAPDTVAGGIAQGILRFLTPAGS